MARAVWPEEFWDAFGRMSADFERPAQVAQRRDGLES